MFDKQIVDIANYILDNKLTIRSAGSFFNIPKSTLHYNLSNRLRKINIQLYFSLHNYLQNNFNEKHIRGGEATKLKYLSYHKK